MNNNKDRLTIRIDKKLIKRLKAYSALEGITASKIIEDLLFTKFPTNYIIAEEKNGDKMTVKFVQHKVQHKTVRKENLNK